MVSSPAGQWSFGRPGHERICLDLVALVESVCRGRAHGRAHACSCNCAPLSKCDRAGEQRAQHRWSSRQAQTNALSKAQQRAPAPTVCTPSRLTVRRGTMLSPGLRSCPPPAAHREEGLRGPNPGRPAAWAGALVKKGRRRGRARPPQHTRPEEHPTSVQTLRDKITRHTRFCLHWFSEKVPVYNVRVPGNPPKHFCQFIRNIPNFFKKLRIFWVKVRHGEVKISVTADQK